MDDPFTGWTVGPDRPRLEIDEVHVWGWTLSGDAEELEPLERFLSDDELTRMRRIRFAADREQFVKARGGLRQILGRYLLQAPESIRFMYGEYGKPTLAEAKGIHFNLSHTKKIAVVALTITGPLGVDVEDWLPVEPALGSQFFSGQELETLKTLSGQEHTRAFFNGWTRKEAICKAEALGLQLLLREFSVSLLPKDEPRVMDAGGVLSRVWRLVDLPLNGGVSGSLAICSPCTTCFYCT